MKSVEDEGYNPGDSEEDEEDEASSQNASQATSASQEQQEERSQHPKPKNVELRFYAEKPIVCRPRGRKRRGRKNVLVCVHIKGKGMRGALQVAGSVSAHTTLTLRVNIHASPLG